MLIVLQHLHRAANVQSGDLQQLHEIIILVGSPRKQSLGHQDPMNRTIAVRESDGLDTAPNEGVYELTSKAVAKNSMSLEIASKTSNAGI